MTEDQERRFRQVCEQAYRRNDMQMLEALRYIRDGAAYGRKDQGQWKPRLKEDWND